MARKWWIILTGEALGIGLVVLTLHLTLPWNFLLHLEPAGARVFLESSGADTNTSTGTSTDTSTGYPAGRLSAPRRELVLRCEAEGFYGETRTVRAAFRFRPTPVEFRLKPVMHELGISVINGSSDILVDGAVWPAGAPGSVAQGAHEILLRRAGFDDQRLMVSVVGPRTLGLRHQPTAGPWVCEAVLPTGRAPKQVTFTPDGRYLVVTLLNDAGFDLIDLEDGFSGRRISAPDAPQKGYVESLMCPGKGTFWISQMTTNKVYEYSLPTPDDREPHLRRTLGSQGVWTKVMAVDPSYRWLAVANWVSNSVAILDYSTGALLANLTGLKVPRGLAFSPDGAFLYIASYEGAAVHKYATATWKPVGHFKVAGSAMRHIVLSADGRQAWVSDMARRSVYWLDTEAMTLLRTFAVDSHPNTIAVSADETRLFVSCRGPNNPKSYMLRSLVDGTVHIIDLRSGKTEAVLQGGNQPTGLALSGDGQTLAFTNFLDDTLELYRFAGSSSP